MPARSIFSRREPGGVGSGRWEACWGGREREFEEEGEEDIRLKKEGVAGWGRRKRR
jgi:hypothetical protein